MYYLKYIGAKSYPKEFWVYTYSENVKVVDGKAQVKLARTKEILLKEGFVEISEEEFKGKKKRKKKNE